MESWEDRLLEIFYSQDLWVQIVAIIVATVLLGFIGYLLKRLRKSSTTEGQSLSVSNSPNATSIQAGRDVVVQDGILNKIALNKENPIKALKVVKDIGKILDDDPHYKTTVSTDANRTSLSFSPRDKDIPFEGGFIFESPKTEEGLKVWEELKESIETGKPVKIDGKYIKDFQVKLGEKGLISQELRTPDALQISPIEDTKPMPATLFVKTEKDEEKLEGILFYLEQGGTRQITISNEKQPYPLKLKIVLDKNGPGTMNFKLKIDEIKTASQAYKIIKFLNTFKFAKCFEINFLERDFPLQTRGLFSKKLHELEDYDKWLPLLEKLDFISNSLKQQIPSPFGRAVSKDDIKNIENAYLIITKGEIPGTVGDLGLLFKRDKAKEFIERCKKEGSIMVRVEKKTFMVNILGIQINLGCCWMEIKLSVEDLEQMSSDLESQQGDSIETVLLKNQKREALLRFKRWETK